MSRLVEEIDAIHDRYREAVNLAVADDDLVRAEKMALAYDTEVTQLIAAREGLTHLLPLRQAGDSRLRQLIRRITRNAA